MQGAEWARLSQPFSPEAFGWYVVETSDDRTQVRLAPYLSTPALTARLDAALGVDGWSFQLLTANGAIVCNLTIAGVSKGAVASASDSLAGPLDPQVLAAIALSRCAGLFGFMLPAAADDGWVDRDTDEGEPLFVPALTEATSAVATTAGVAAAMHASAEGAEEHGVTAATDSAPPATATAAAEPTRPDGHQVIDRLVERLKSEGLGRQAARLVLEHHGYGRTPEEARELYGKLRNLLVEKTLVTP